MSDELLLGLGGLAVLLGLIAIRVPIAYAMILVGMIGISIVSSPDIILNQLKTLAYAQFSIYDLSVLPMFILMGSLAARSGLSKDLFRAADAWLGWQRGGVAMAAIAACGAFGAVCGSSTATASTMGKVALPELRRYNYAPSLATGCIAAGGTLGILIPPSVVLIVYSIIVEANVVSLFAAALVPGLLAVVMFVIAIGIYVRLVPSAGPKGERVTLREWIGATVAVIPVLVIFGIVIGGIYAGIYNPTPAAAIGVFLVGAYALATRRIDWAEAKAALLETAKTTGMIMLILLGAEILKIFMSRAGVPQAAAEALGGSGLSPLMILILVVVVFLILGCLLDSLSMIILAIPFFWPVFEAIATTAFANVGTGDPTLWPAVEALAYPLGTEVADPNQYQYQYVTELKLWFGVIILVVVELGLITPPVGLNVFIINSLAPDVPMRKTFAGVMPFFFTELIRVAILIAFPVITLFLPRLLQ